jgi:hypothetical protein
VSFGVILIGRPITCERSRAHLDMLAAAVVVGGGEVVVSPVLCARHEGGAW